MMTASNTRQTVFKQWAKKSKIQRTWPLWLMLLIPIICLIIFHYMPMVGLKMAFVRYNPVKGIWGSPWVGLKNFDKFFGTAKFNTILINTITIASLKIATNILTSLIFAILLTEIRWKAGSKFFQSTMLFPWFVSWVILGTLLKILFVYEGPVNQIISSFGFEKIRWFSSNRAFRFLLIASNTWKGMGYNMIIFITAIYGIDPGMFEAATVDGANKFQQKIHITIPAIMPMIMLRLILSLGSILSAGSEQILVLYNSAVYDSAEIIDTYVYKMGIESAQYPFATAVGLFKSIISGALIVFSYWVATRTTDYRIF